MSDQTYVIVGANLAGGRAAEALRGEGFDGRVVLIGAEPDRPYERPPLSKELLRGSWPEEKVYLRPPAYYAEQQIDLRLGQRATRLDPAAHQLELADGERLHYDKILITTGASPIRLPVPGADLPGVLYLRTVRECLDIAGRINHPGKVVVVGAGFIGAEAAATSRQKGQEVVCLEALPVPLQRALGDQLGAIYTGIHRDQGVDLRVNAKVIGFRGHQKVEQVLLEDGAAIDCDFTIVGVGVRPEVGWLADSSLEISNGIVVNELTEASLPDVYAAGDVANWYNPLLGERLRVEHWDNAQNQGIAAAKSMLGKGEVYAPVPYFWSDQYDLRMQYVGHGSGQDDIVIRGSVESRSFTAFFMRDGKVRAALGVNRTRDVNAAKRLIQAGVTADVRQLADDSVDLRQLARALTQG